MRAAQQADKQLSPVITALSTNIQSPHHTAPGLEQCFLEDGLLFHKFQELSNVDYTQLVLLSSLCYTILQKLHDDLGHSRLWKELNNDTIGQGMSWMYRNGLQNVPLASNTMLHNPLQQLLWDYHSKTSF